jgi:hypothetical protein
VQPYPSKVPCAGSCTLGAVALGAPPPTRLSGNTSTPVSEASSVGRTRRVVSEFERALRRAGVLVQERIELRRHVPRPYEWVPLRRDGWGGVGVAAEGGHRDDRAEQGQSCEG